VVDIFLVKRHSAIHMFFLLSDVDSGVKADALPTNRYGTYLAEGDGRLLLLASSSCASAHRINKVSCFSPVQSRKYSDHFSRFIAPLLGAGRARFGFCRPQPVRHGKLSRSHIHHDVTDANEICLGNR
jgi:hypothetical protein